ncbi:MAG: ATP-dependent DNA helicase RecG, partial [Anaerolineales bacterium]
GTLEHISQRKSKDSKTHLVEAIISDGTGALRVTWFNQPWRTRRMQIGAQYALAGKIDKYLGRLTINNPEPDPIDQQMLSSNRIVPVYPSTEHITQRWLRKIMNEVVSYWAPKIQDHLPVDIRKSAGLMELSTAILQIHYPDSFEKLNQARYRLAFDEIFLLQIGVQQQRQSWQNNEARTFKSNETWIENFINRLPFTLTSAQKSVLEDIRTDLSQGQPMNRLLQGDVGSGKTIIAAIAVAMIAEQGSQAALMAPTSILAEQHYHNIKEFLCKTKQDIETNDSSSILQEKEVKMLVGATPETQKNAIRDELSNGDIKLIIGTHALIEENIEFNDLQLIIIDEQHRFGVQQRSKLRNKGINPHLLVMTATPIPRSLALTIYGDLDISVIDEAPPGRKEIKTYILPPVQRERAYNLIRKQVYINKQAFIIYPLVEESENSEARAAVEEYERLKMEIFPQHKLRLLHGRMKQDEKDEIMAAFRAHDFDILISTSVIEVGVDIPHATVMLIEGANHFGL